MSTFSKNANSPTALKFVLHALAEIQHISKCLSMSQKNSRNKVECAYLWKQGVYVYHDGNTFGRTLKIELVATHVETCLHANCNNSTLNIAIPTIFMTHESWVWSNSEINKTFNSLERRCNMVRIWMLPIVWKWKY